MLDYSTTLIPSYVLCDAITLDRLDLFIPDVFDGFDSRVLEVSVINFILFSPVDIAPFAAVCTVSSISLSMSSGSNGS